MNAPLPVRPARARAETLKKKKKEAREASARRRVEAEAAVAAALRRGRLSFAERLGAAVESAKFDGDLDAWDAVGFTVRRHDTAKRARIVGFVAAVEAISPGLCLVPYGRHRVLGQAVVNMAVIADRLLRPVTSWQPRSRSQVRRWDELVAHVCCAYPQPPVLESAFLQPNLSDELRAVAPFIGLGGSWREAGLPTPITRAVAHRLSTSKERWGSLTIAVRQAQAVVAGVGPAHRRALLRCRPSWCFDAAKEELWLSVLGWLGRNPGVTADDVHAIFVALDDVDAAFSLRGRTATSLCSWARDRLRQVQLREKGRVDVGPLPRCSIDGGRYVLTREVDRLARVFSLEQIVDGAALVDEGLAMRHCVGTYADEAKAGGTAIFSMRVARFGEAPRRALTIEVDTTQNTIEQVRGKTNRSADADERTIVACWARERHLKIDEHAM